MIIPAQAWYTAETDRLRSSARWVASGLAAIGLALLAGVQLTSLGRLDGTRLGVAISAVVIALGGVAWMIDQSVQIFTTPWISLADISEREFLEGLLENAPRPVLARILHRRSLQPITARELMEELDRQGNSLYRHVATDLPQLHERLRQANLKAATATEATGATRQSDLRRVQELRAAAQALVTYANYQRTRLAFQRLVPRLLSAGAIVAATIIVYAWAANPPTPKVHALPPNRLATPRTIL